MTVKLIVEENVGKFVAAVMKSSGGKIGCCGEAWSHGDSCSAQLRFQICRSYLSGGSKLPTCWTGLYIRPQVGCWEAKALAWLGSVCCRRDGGHGQAHEEW
uniref:Uncharacterized protein n=1 Tax=Kalanchoe fedtschenkoi TaxID=63787 RepID=A0A7N0TZX2_KALFE